MAPPASPQSWWDRWFKKSPSPSRRAGRPVQSARQTRRTSAPVTAAGPPVQSPAPAPREHVQAPAAASCPSIVIQQASSAESHDSSRSPSPAEAVAGPSGHSGGVCTSATDHTSQPSCSRPIGPEPAPAGPLQGGIHPSDQAERAADVSASEKQPSDNQEYPPDEPSSTLRGEFERANRVVLASESPPDSPARADDSGVGESTAAPTESLPTETDKLLGDLNAALQGVTSFEYQTKEKKKISELKHEGQKLLDLWRDALDKKDTLMQIIRECTDATNQSGERLGRDVRELEVLYDELGEALANLQRTTSRHRAVKADITAMKTAVGAASANEQAEVGKVAATHEKEVYTKWQALKTSPDIEALEKLRGELTEKQRALNGLDTLVRRRLDQLQRADGGGGRDDTAVAGKVSAQRAIPQPAPPAGRRGGAARGKRRLAERGGNSSGQQRVIPTPRAHGASCVSSGVSSGVSAVATQAGPLMSQGCSGGGGGAAPVSIFNSTITTTAGGGFTTATTSSTTTSSAQYPPPPPPPPPPPLPGRRAPADEEDDSGADETSTSADEEGRTPDGEEALLAAAFPLQFGPALFDALEPSEQARAIANALHFR